ncbi:Cytochrome c oxidase [Cinnamomum micranthum f. kanehirae]|uniref:Cytochrome c oxidase n=1 Tax=Cinnamomum micranthum f. kanehirae TaxID=337451 RepID=A0A3S3MJF5_9MAGN|nr:Cytochrome c oxidase [Cinnamomum micranthum f. kanehirae]
MSSSNVEPHDKMRARDVGRVARGEQAPRPAHEPGSISEAPPHPEDDAPFKVLEIRTAPADMRFPTTNQTRHCYTRYIEYHKCVRAKGENAPECDKFARCYRSLCPTEWVVQWNEQRELGIFPGPL